MSNPCEWNGTRYRSQAAVAAAAGVDQSTVCRHLTLHGHLDGLARPKAPPPESKYCPEIRRLLPLGYGAEDIALHLAVSPAAIRSAIASMRASGEIACMFQRPTASAGGQA